MSLHSPRWHRVAALRPRLPAQLRVCRQQLRGQTWMLLSEAGGTRSVRLNAAAWELAGRFDGTRSVQQLWERTLQHGDDAITQDELIDLLAQLREAALLRFEHGADFDALLPHLDRVQRTRRRGNLLVWRVPLADPSAWLDRLGALPRLLFSRAAFVTWLAAMAVLLALVAQHAPTLWAHGIQWLATPRYAALALALYVPIKLLHELAHGLAVRRFGGSVREAGVTFMLLMPVPYVDASAANAFARRRERLAVSGAGIAAELALAALALPLWLALDDGWLRDTAFVTLFIAGVSTLLFNANPLQRLDGYYILIDVAGLPNLASRSRHWWLDQLRRRLLRLGGDAFVVARGETAWLAGYAPLAWAMSLLIATLAVFWLGQLSFALGALAALLLGWQLGLRAPLRVLRELRRAALAQQRSARRWRVLAAGALTALLLLLAMPWPQHTLVQGVVWPEQDAQLRTDEDGRVDALLRADGEMVRRDEVVLQLSNPPLQARLAGALARQSAREALLFGALPHADGARAGDARAELAAANAEVEQLRARVDALAVRARRDGRVALDLDLAGQQLRRGSLVGQVLGDAAPVVRVALPEARAADVPHWRDAASVRLAASLHTAFDATLLRDSVAAVRQLPSAALSQRHGGSVATEADALQPLQPVVLLDVRLPDAARTAAARIGERAWVRFDAGRAPLAMQGLVALRSRVLQRFNAQF